MCWQLIVTNICQYHCENYQPALRYGNDEPCDLVVGQYAIDMKYRLGSGDSATLKKFKKYGSLLRDNGYDPTLLILRNDNLPAAIKACKSGSWNALTGQASLEFIEQLTNFPLEKFLQENTNKYPVQRV